MKVTVNGQEYEQDDVICAECGSVMTLRYSKKFEQLFYGCSLYPKCTGTIGSHPDGRVLGIPANKETKAARVKAHEIFDSLWKSGFMSRVEAYLLLSEKMGLPAEETHIALFDKAQCEKAIKVLEVVFDKAFAKVKNRHLRELARDMAIETFEDKFLECGFEDSFVRRNYLGERS